MRRLLGASLIVLSLLSSACLKISLNFPIPDVCQDLNNLPLTDLTAAAPTVKFEDAGGRPGDAWVRDGAASVGQAHHYTASPTGGTLRYRLGSILADDDSWPPHVIRHRVTLLGIRALGGGLRATQRPPQPPSGGIDRK